MFALICAWTNGSATNRNAGDLRRLRYPHGVIVMRITESFHYSVVTGCTIGCHADHPSAIGKRQKWHCHDDVIKWKHFPRNRPFVRGIHRSRYIPHKRPVTWSFDVFFDLRLNKRLSKQSWGWWFETLSRSLWRHRNGDNSWFPVMRRIFTPITDLYWVCGNCYLEIKNLQRPRLYNMIAH